MFDLAPEYAELQASVRKLAQDKVAPRAREIDTDGRVSAGSLRGLPRRGAARPGDPRGVRRGRGRHSRPHDRDRRGRQVLEHRRVDAAAHPPADRSGADRRQRGAEADVRARRCATGEQRAGFGLSEPQAGSDVVGMRTKAVADGRRLGPQRHEVLDVGRRAGRLVLRVRQDRSRRLAQARRHLVLHRRALVARASRSAAPTTRWACAASTPAS